MPDVPNNAAHDAALSWLLRMRWVAVASQLATIAFAVLVYQAPLDLVGLGAAVAVAAASNTLLLIYRDALRRHAYRLLVVLLSVDTLLLTAMLLISGGLHNPFTSFFLLHITMATILLRRREATILTALCFACVLAIYRFPGGDHHAHHWITMDMHFTGMMVTLCATGVCILLFVGRLQAELRRQEAILRANEEKLGRQQRVVGLATLAAGIAHELATPLSTIAVASHELRLTADSHCQNKLCLSDSILIRREVDRCRAIIDRLSSRGESTARRTVTLTPGYLTQSLGDYLAPACLARLQIDCPQPATLEIEEVAFLQSLAALIKNGCEADEKGGAVVLSIRHNNGGVQLAVTDHGVGIPDSVLGQLGEPFVTTKEPGRGIGLGLYLVHLFCYLHEAELRVARNAAGPGSQVEIRFRSEVPA